jgi:hypothetical protein
VNPLLIDDGLKPPPNALTMPLYKGMTAEEIYPLLDDNDQSETLDKHAYEPVRARARTRLKVPIGSARGTCTRSQVPAAPTRTRGG